MRCTPLSKLTTYNISCIDRPNRGAFLQVNLRESDKLPNCAFDRTDAQWISRELPNGNANYANKSTLDVLIHINIIIQR